MTVVRYYSSWLSPGAIPLSSVLASPVMGCAVQALQDSHSSPTLHKVTLEYCGQIKHKSYLSRRRQTV